MTTAKTIALTRQTFVGKVMSQLFNMLSRLVITFLSRIKHLLISWLQSSSAVISEPPNIKSATWLPPLVMYRIQCLSHVVTEKTQSVFQRGLCMHSTSILSMFLYDSLLSVYPSWPGVYFSLYQLRMGLFALVFLDNLSTDSLSDMHFLGK